MVVSLGPLIFLLHFSLEGAAVEKSSERIDQGLVLKVLLVLNNTAADAHPSQELRERKRLSNIIIRPKIKSLDTVSFLDPCRDQNNIDILKRWVAANLPH